MLFFFSSRRRHTRWPRDWSSDVCSSDLRWWWWHIQRTTQIEFADINSNVFNNLIIRNFYRNRLTGWWWRCFNLPGLDNFFHLNNLLLVQNDHFRSFGNPVKFYYTNTN